MVKLTFLFLQESNVYKSGHDCQFNLNIISVSMNGTGKLAAAFDTKSIRPREKLTGLCLTVYLIYVAHHATFLIEALMAHGAAKGLLPCVSLHVDLNFGWSVKGLTTHITLVEM